LTHPEESLEVGQIPSCGGKLTTEVVLVDQATGEERWRQPVPWTPSPPVVVDDQVVTVGREVDGYPPSVSSVRSGATEWSAGRTDIPQMAGRVHQEWQSEWDPEVSASVQVDERSIAVLLGEPERELVVFDVSNGRERWRLGPVWEALLEGDHVGTSRELLGATERFVAFAGWDGATVVVPAAGPTARPCGRARSRHRLGTTRRSTVCC
jgi:outer membrane protein assembly factor BamB